MSRLALTPQSLSIKYPALPVTAGALKFVFTNAGASFADGASHPLTGNEIVLVHNGNGGAQTVTVSSRPDPETGRTGDITAYSVGAGEYAVLPQFPTAGWIQADGSLYFAASATDVAFAVLRLV